MRHSIIIIITLILLTTRCTSPSLQNAEEPPVGRQLPRVLFITSGIGEEVSQLAQGIVIAIQSLNKAGAMVRLEPRDVIYHFEELNKYNIIILSTFPGYHDADRKYSLSYMSDEELSNLCRFVANGGILVSGENIGRNYPDGTDRIALFTKLTAENWELAKCYGASFTEKNMTGFGLEGIITDDFRWELPVFELSDGANEVWTLVPDTNGYYTSSVLGSWKNIGNSVSAFIENKYEKGIAYYLPFSGFLHPKNEGGLWSEDQIDRFYKYIIDKYNKVNGINISLNPWPNGHDFAFSISLNAEGNITQYERIFKLLNKENIKPTIFVSGLVDNELKAFLKQKAFPLESNGFSYNNFNEMKYPQAVDDILRNENYWGIDFKGFRFPFTNPEYWGLLALDEHHYSYESSIGANNMDFFHGSVVPYNLVISGDGFYKSTDILEVAPTYHDDYYFLKAIKNDQNPDSMRLGKNVMVYRKYLQNYWNYAVKPYKGSMVFLGHPKFVGYNDTTLSALKSIIHEIKKDNTWITTIGEVSDFRTKLAGFQFYVENDQRNIKIFIDGPENVFLEDVCLNYNGKLENVSAKKGKVRLVENATGTQLIFVAFKGQTLTLQIK